jgi:hypothetical protein
MIDLNEIKVAILHPHCVGDMLDQHVESVVRQLLSAPDKERARTSKNRKLKR